ncbi:OmpA family protein [Fulvivirga lutea]|uniref:OmpA family protein n=1 Tax=Fulvivirga lutea TaxID=2810512 RepID=A0A975A0R8_9BACT|nr:OmpA family protein [Fulvivirga lutea]QSE97674.1 OmpA family protein [Fulvivirga lutea]
MYHKLRLLFFLTLFLGFGLSSIAQDEDAKETAQTYIELAETMMDAAQPLVDVRDIYVQAAEADPTNIIANWRAGDFYLKTVGKKNAVKYFLRVLELDAEYRFDIEYWIGQSYHYGMEFDKALAFYSRYRQKLIDRDGYRGRDRIELSVVDRKIYECQNAIEFVANPAHYSIVNVGSAINSEYEEYGPVLNEDETILIFTSRRREGNLNENVFSDNKPYEDIFISTKKNGQWSKAENIGNVVNTPFHDSNLALSADGTQLFLYKDENNGDIYESDRKEDGTWTFPEPLSESVNSEGFKEASISISPDGQILFFASDRPGGQGGIDIYYSIKDRNGEWARSKNLGPKINTEYDDDAPFIDYDGKTLYFSSLGRKGMGGYDIFKSTYDSAAAEWGDPENLGFPINTPDDDIFFVSTKDGKRGYYASVREDGMGFTDIYMVTILQEDEVADNIMSKTAEEVETEPKEETTKDLVAVKPKTEELQPVILTVKVLDESKNPLEAKVSLTSSDNLVAGKTNKGPGVFEFKVSSKESKTYNLSVENSGYVFQNLDITLPAATTVPQIIDRTVTMRKLEVGTRSVLRNIYFNFNKATFRDESYPELNKLESMMAENSGLQIEISGHTDNIGPKDYNKALSQRRANAVKDYLVKKGIDARRITAVGYGEERPLASNDDEKEGRELNRRVEFKVLSGK